jgi:hypothetical protein
VTKPTRNEEAAIEGPRLCANPACLCETRHFTCSLWCGSLDVPAGVRCPCRHDECLHASVQRPTGSGSGVTYRKHEGQAVA